jgi:hypothetical protein
MPIPDDRPLDEYDEEAVESSTLPDMLDEGEDELEFETADADTSDELLGATEDSDSNDEGFGFGDPAD